ncbi:alpha/beta hydrolase [Vallitalea pronyensis]|uniref:Alpha/beta hydrolase n=1 Tax=Vallitalea pronyensis TaxID=1348613 RepID=A0A8J8MN01_9FIRM|nr:alpha/beta hydrolase [Vallitalea pronyensis]QUI24755.1 alpha/beta hydrolase [Vallitalea pronyensis]
MYNNCVSPQYFNRVCPEFPLLHLKKIETIHVNGANNFRISVKITGNPKGIPIVFIHGFSESWLLWNFQLNSPMLLKKHRLIAIDMRGQGESQPKSLDLNNYKQGSLYAQDINAVFKELDIMNAIVVAHSLGGTWFSDYLLAFGTTRIRGVLFVASPIDVNTPMANALFTEQLLDVIPFVTDPCLQTTAIGLGRFISLLFNCRITKNNLEELLSYISLVPSQIRENLLLHEPLSAKDVLPYIDVPVLVMHSYKDRVINFQASVRVNKLAPKSKLILFREIGHSIFAEMPKTFNRILCQFAIRPDIDKKHLV